CPEGEPLKTLAGHSGSVWSVSVSRDGQTIVSGGDDGTVRLWSPEGEPLKTLAGHSGWVRSVSVSRDGQTIVSGGDDGTVRLWNFDLDDLLARGCTWLQDYLRYHAKPADKQLCDGVWQSRFQLPEVGDRYGWIAEWGLDRRVEELDKDWGRRQTSSPKTITWPFGVTQQIQQWVSGIVQSGRSQSE
ncbi:MAG: hypothetical protein F6K19_07225, partial [Cyanothece sp. SIO1E1]|nr:hypothetical protein [Cyanothece sp. SIO1E1]